MRKVLLLLTVTAGFLICFDSTINAQTYNMSNALVTDDAGTIYDSGGPTGNYGDNENLTFTICPATAPECLRLDFTDFFTEDAFDVLSIYDGPGATSPLIGNFSGGSTGSPGSVTVSTGCITLVFTSDFIGNFSGWAAEWSICDVPGVCPTIEVPPVNAEVCAGQCTDLVVEPTIINETTDYFVENIDFNPYPYTDGATLPIPTDDVWSGIISIGFDFCFYGNTYNQLLIGTNGIVSFNTGDAGGYCEWPIDNPFADAGGVTNSIGFPFHDIDPSVGGTIRYGSFGAAPCRYFVVSFVNVPMFSCNGLLATQQLVLYESSNMIDTYIENKPLCSTWNSGAAIHGIQNAAGNVATVVPGRNYPTTWTTTNDGKRFVPDGAPIYDVTWFDGPTVVGTGTSVSVCPTDPTTYTAEVVYDLCNGSTITETADVFVDIGGDLDGSSTFTDSSCGANDGSITVTPTGGNGSYVYNWNNSETTATISNLGPGDYTVTVTDTSGDGCEYVETITIADNNPLSATFIANPPLCDGLADGEIIISPSGGLAPYQYQWDNGTITDTGTGASIVGLEAGTYNITLADANFCTFEFTVDVPLGTPLTVSGTPTPPSCNGLADGSIDLVITNGTPPYTYGWIEGIETGTGTGTSIPDLLPGSYLINVTDANGCEASTTIDVAPGVDVSISATPTSPDCGGSATGSIDLTVTNGTPPYSIEWTDGVVTNTTTDTTIPDLVAGSYDITLIDVNGCTAITTVVVTDGPSISVSATPTSPSCSGLANGSIDLTPVGGTAPYTFEWLETGGTSGTGTGTSIVDIVASSYDITITDANGCTATTTIDVIPGVEVTVSATPTSPTCGGAADGSIDLTVTNGTPPYTYEWNDGTTSSTGTGTNIPGLAAGTYNITLTDTNGCSAITTIDVVDGLNISVTGTATPPQCAAANDGSINLTVTDGTPPYAYDWDNTFVTGSGIGTDIPDLDAGTYTITVTDDVGCSATTTVDVSDGLPITVSGTSTPPTCGASDASITLTSDAIPPFTYEWNNGAISDTGSGTSIDNLEGGTYAITVTDVNGCTATTTVDISASLPLVLTLVPVAESCNGSADGSITLNLVDGVPPYDFVWDNGTTQEVGTGTNITGISAGTYDVTVTDANGCSATDDVIIGVGPGISVTVLSNEVNCADDSNGQIDVTVSNGLEPYTIDWTDGVIVGSEIGSSISGLNGGSYDLTVTDANGCSAITTALIVEPAALVLTLTPTDVLCSNDNGAIDMIVDNGTPPYDYNWVNSTTSNTGSGTGLSLTDLEGGDYSVTVTDVNGCTAEATTSINEAEPLTASGLPSPASCNGTSDASILVQISGGTPDYTYTWTNTAGDFGTGNTPFLDNLAAGDYFFTVTDALACDAVFTVTVDEPLPLEASTLPTDVSCNGAADGVIDISVTNGTAPYTLDWENLAGDVGSIAGTSITDLNGGTYTITVTDANTCSTTTEATITEAEALTLGAANSDCAADLLSYFIDFTVIGGIAPYTIDAGANVVSDNGGGSFTVSGIEPATDLNLTITDAEGCTLAETITGIDCSCPDITPPTAIDVPIVCNGAFPDEISVEDPGAGFTVNWYNTAAGGTILGTGPIFLPPTIGTYYAEIVEDDTDCPSDRTAIILLENAPIFIAESDFSCSDDLTSYDLTVFVSGGDGVFTLEAEDGSGNSLVVNDIGGGNFEIIGIPSGEGAFVFVEDGLGCEATVDTQPQDCDCPVIEPPLVDDVFLCPGDEIPQLNAPIPADGFQVQWLDAGSGIILSEQFFYTPISPGIILVQTIELASGCTSNFAEVNILQSPAINFTQGDFDCSDDFTAYDLDISVSGGGGALTVEAQSEAGTPLVANFNGGGNYTIVGITPDEGVTVTVTDANDCSETFTTTPQTCGCPSIDPPSGLLGATVCFGDPLPPLQADIPPAGFIVNWYSDAAASILVGTGAVVIPSVTGTYYAQIEEVISGCTSPILPIDIAENAEITIVENGFSCATDLQSYQYEITASGGNGVATFSITATSTFGTSLTITGTAGNYTIEGIPPGEGATVTVTDDLFCENTLVLPPQTCDCPVIPEPSTPVDNFYCFTDVIASISVDDPGSDFVVNWYNTPAGGASIGTGASFTPPAAGTYYADLTEIATNCVGDRIPVTLTQGNEIVVAQTNNVCADDLLSYTATIEVSGGDGNYTVNVIEANPIVETAAGIYDISDIPTATFVTVEVTDGTGCSVTVALNPFNCDCPTIPDPLNPQDNFYCFGGTPTTLAVDAAAPGFSIQWFDTPTGGTLLNTGEVFTPATAGTYYAQTLEDATGCVSNTIAATLTEGNPTDLVETGFTCSGDLLTYSLVITVSGDAPFTVVDDNGFAVSDSGGGLFTIIGIPSNTASSVIVTDANGCIIPFDLAVYNCDCPAIPAPIVDDAFYCFDAAIPTITTNDPGLGFSVVWQDEAGAELATGLSFTPAAAGNYGAQVIEDATGCTSAITPFTVSQNPEISITYLTSSCSADLTTYTWDIEVSGGTAPYVVTETTAAYTVTNNPDGTYSIAGIDIAATIDVLVTDAEGCTFNLASLPVNCDCPSIDAPANPTNVFYCFGETPAPLSVDAAPAGFQVIWFDETNTPVDTGTTYTPATDGTYTALYDEIATGCQGPITAATLTGGSETTFVESTGSCAPDLLTYSVNLAISGDAPFTLTVEGGLSITDIDGSNFTINDIPSGSNAVGTITDANDCVIDFTTLITDCLCPTIEPPTNPVDGFNCFGETAASLSVDAAPAGFQVIWLDSDNTQVATGESFVPTADGTYTAILEEIATGCQSAGTNATLTSGSEIVISESNVQCSDDLNVFSIDINATGDAPFTLSSNVGDVTVIDDNNLTIENIPSGSAATVTLTDANDCTTDYTTAATDCLCPTIAPPTNPVDVFYCFGDTPDPLSVDAAPAGFQVIWLDASNTQLATGETLAAPADGTYTAILEEIATGCQSAGVTATLSSGSEITYIEGASTCAADLSTYDLSFSLTGDAPFVIDNADGLSITSSDEFNFTIEAIASGANVSITVTDANACTSTFTTSVTDCNCPTIEPPISLGDVTYCIGDAIPSISVEAPPMGFSINWYDVAFGGDILASSTSFNPPAVGTYYAEIIEDATGCTSARTAITVSENPLPLANFAASAAIICQGESVNFNLLDPINANATYNWDFGNGNAGVGSDEQTATYANTGLQSISLTVTDENGCVNTSTQSIEVSAVTASITPLVATILGGESITLDATGTSIAGSEFSYVWSPDSTLNCNDCPSVVATPSVESSVYTVIVTDEFGCNASATATVNVNYEKLVIIPNAFSPNGDGVNDIFRLNGYGIANVELLIFNRWGGLVFEATDITDLSQGWDGTVNGEDAELEVYVYVAKVTFTDETEELFKGNVTLVR